MTKRKPSKTSKAKASAPNANKVRIIGGQFRGRHLNFIDAPGLRPTPDRVRETVFNWLTPYLNQARVLDACSGSGAFGFESVSRGARHCTFIEINKQQCLLLKDSAQQLNLKPTETCLNSESFTKDSHLPRSQTASRYEGSDTDSYHTCDANAALTLTPSVTVIQGDTESTMNILTQPYDVVFIDPPYAESLWQPILNSLITNRLIHQGSVIYLEADKPLIELAFPEFMLNKMTILKQKKMGQIYSHLLQITSEFS